jgi:serine/threonine protein kinase
MRLPVSPADFCPFRTRQYLPSGSLSARTNDLPLSLDQFASQLSIGGLFSADEATRCRAEINPKDAEAFARELVKQKKLTQFQAQQCFAGKGKSLVLGNYVILDKLGQGGMGLVLKAQHKRMKRIVALKVLSPSVAKSPELIARFQREVEAAARLTHPNIVAAFDADEAASTFFLVMEYVDGKDLSSVVKATGPLQLDQAIRCLLQAARGLDFAHKHGVIHRDIKPANLLLDTEGTVKILDMGLARIEGDTQGKAELTSTGAVMGTVDYMAPEQAMSTKHADARSDIYSLGVTLWYLLVGKPVFDGDTLMARLIAHREFPPPSLKAVRTEVPAGLEALFQRMLSKKPGDRPQSMAEVVTALEAIQRGDSSTILKAATAPGDDAQLHSFLSNLGTSDSTRTIAAPPTAPSLAATHVESVSAQAEVTVTSGDKDEPTDPVTHTRLPVAEQWRRKVGTGAGFASLPAGWWRNRRVQVAAAAGLLAIVLVAVLSNSQDADEVAPATVASSGDPSANIGIPAATAESALVFDGLNDRVDLPPLAISRDGPLTIEAIVQLDEHSPGGVIAQTHGAVLRLLGDQLQFGGNFQGGTRSPWVYGRSMPVPRGRPVHLAGVFDGPHMRLFVAGQRVDANELGASLLLFPGPTTLGNLGPDGTQAFRGQMHAVRFSAAARYDADFSPPATLVSDSQTAALYLFDDASGTQLTDHSGNSRHGLIEGANWANRSLGSATAPREAAGESPAASTQQSFASGEWIDVIPLIDPELDKVGREGTTGLNDWAVTNGELTVGSADNRPCKLVLPVSIQGPSVEVEVELTRTGGPGGFHIDLPCPNGILPVTFGEDRLKRVAIGRLNDPINGTCELQTGQRTVVRVVMRRQNDDDIINVSFNDLTVGPWRGRRNLSALTTSLPYPFQERISLWTTGSEFTFHRIRVRMLDGGTAATLGPAPVRQANQSAPGLATHPLVSDAFEWSAPENLGPGINTTDYEDHAAISADELTLVYSHRTPERSELWWSRRAAATERFPPGVRLSDAINTGPQNMTGFLSPDGLTLWFSSTRTGGAGGFDLYMAQRKYTRDDFSAPKLVPGSVNSAQNETSPFVTADGLTLLFARGEPRAIYQATRTDRRSPFGEPQLVSNVNSGTWQEFPLLTGDGKLLLLIASQVGGPQTIAVASRSTLFGDFSETRELGVHDVAAANGGDKLSGLALSADERSLYFSSERPGGEGRRDLWVIHRVPKSTPASAETDATAGGPDWDVLFDAATGPSGWRIPGPFQSKDGLFVADQRGFAVSQESYDDFELTFDWRVGTGANGGVFYRLDSDHVSIVNDVEMQLVDNVGHQNGQNPLTRAGALCMLMPPVRDAARPMGEWNSGRIVARGNSVEHWINDQQVVAYEIGSPQWTETLAKNSEAAAHASLSGLSGRIALQAYTGEVAFRNIRIRRLEPQFPPATTETFALQFDGIDDYVDLTSDWVWDGGELTLDAWVQYEPKTSVESSFLLALDHGDDATRRFARVLAQTQFTAGEVSGANLIVTNSDPAAPRLRQSTVGHVLQRPTHLAAVWKNGAMTLFVDGVRQISPTAATGIGTRNGTPYTLLGAAFASANHLPKDFWKGSVFQLRLSSRALYENDFAPETTLSASPDTISLYRCNEGAGDVLRDSSGNDRNGQIHGASWVRVDGRDAAAAHATDREAFGLRFDGVDDYAEVSSD